MQRKAEADYQRGMKYKDIAEKYGVSINTVKSWKQRHGWKRQKVHPLKKVCTQKDRVHHQAIRTPPAIKAALLKQGMF